MKLSNPRPRLETPGPRRRATVFTPALTVLALLAALATAGVAAAQVETPRFADPARGADVAGADESSPLAVEQRKHLARLAQLARLRQLARELPDSELMEETTNLEGKERWRHRVQLERLAAAEDR